jgi:hypothetical protein
VTGPAASRRDAYLERPAPSSLADVVDLILDKGLVIDAFVRVSLLGIELVTVDARVVVASVDTYLRFADATNRLDLYKHETSPPELPKEMKRKVLKGAAKGVLGGAKDVVSETLFGNDESR